jgi:uncharacterized membrane protein YeaQ/YmgE (transglycosylase-associated protein family)
MYDYPRHSIRARAARIARQRGWIGEGGGPKVLPIVLLVVAALAVLWLATAMSGLVFALVPAALVGLLTGWVASKLTGARLGLGWTLVAGVVGSWLGSALFGLLGLSVGGLLNPIHLMASVLGATILIAFARLVARPALPGANRPRFGRL